MDMKSLGSPWPYIVSPEGTMHSHQLISANFSSTSHGATSVNRPDCAARSLLTI